MSEKKVSRKTLRKELKSKSFWATATHLSPQRQILVVSLSDANSVVEGLVAELKKLTPDYDKVLWAIKSDKEKKQIFQYAFEMVKTQVLVSLGAKEENKK